MKNIGTLVGAPIRPNDSADQYPAALQSEIRGGHHTRATIAERDAIGTWLREAGMYCYVIAEQSMYRLKNDLVTWELAAGNGDGDPGNDNVQLISGNFGAWTALSSYHASIHDQLQICYKSDLQAFPTRAITYLQGQFYLDAAFTATSITLGSMPANSRPKAQIKKYLIVANIEMYLIIETNGDVKLQSKDSFNLPADNAAAPYYLDTFYNPDITLTPVTTYTATRTQNFARNDCGLGQIGSVVSFSKTYQSTVDQATADAMAASDPTFNTDGQAYANDPAHGTCTVDPNNYIDITSSTGGLISVRYSDGTHAQTISNDDAHSHTLVGPGPYELLITTYGSAEDDTADVQVKVNTLDYELTQSGNTIRYTGINTPITIDFKL